MSVGTGIYLKQRTKPCMMNIGPGIWGVKLYNTVDAYVPAKLLTLTYHWSQAHFRTVPLSVLTPSRLQWNPARTLTPLHKKLIKFLKAAVDVSRDAHVDIIISNSDVCTVPSNEWSRLQILWRRFLGYSFWPGKIQGQHVRSTVFLVLFK